MSDLSSITSSLENKIEKFVALHHSIKNELSALKIENTNLNLIIEQQKETLKVLEEKGKVLKLAKSLSTTNENTTDLKLKVNELIREVDKCISLLNK
jgi:ABC-type transporter Mla subunit MlaD